jgi:hypothetical protein
MPVSSLTGRRGRRYPASTVATAFGPPGFVEPEVDVSALGLPGGRDPQDTQGFMASPDSYGATALPGGHCRSFEASTLPCQIGSLPPQPVSFWRRRQAPAGGSTHAPKGVSCNAPYARVLRTNVRLGSATYNAITCSRCAAEFRTRVIGAEPCASAILLNWRTKPAKAPVFISATMRSFRAMNLLAVRSASCALAARPAGTRLPVRGSGLPTLYSTYHPEVHVRAKVRTASM